MTETTVTYRYGPPFPLNELTVYGLLHLKLTQEIIHFLQAHHIQVEKNSLSHEGYHDDYYLLTFPEGTTEQRLFPLLDSDRFQLTLPDGTVIQSMYNAYVNTRYAVPVYSIGPGLAALEHFLKQNPQYDTRPT